MENIKLVILNNGLGNQLYQYAFMRFLELSTKEKLVLDNSSFWGEKVDHNGYELEKVFGLKLDLLSNYFTKNVWLNADYWRDFILNLRFC